MAVSVTDALFERVAAAPISWGVCEMPGWGYQLPPTHVLSDMAAAGFTHTELGSLGYLPTEADDLRRTLDGHGLSLLGGFVPLVLHDPAHTDTTLQAANRWAGLLSAAGASFFVTCPISDPADWRQAPLRGRQWNRLCAFLDRLDELCATYGLTQAVHPHVGCVVETRDETERVLEGSQASIVLDTAHLTLGGVDVVNLAQHHSHRVALVHLKDVDEGVAGRHDRGEVSFMEAVQNGLFPPLGDGHVPVADVIRLLERNDRDLWYVLEQDAALTGPEPRAVQDLRHNIDKSINFLRSHLAVPLAG